MKHCSLGRNVTIAFPEMKTGNFFYLENNQLKGLLGEIINKYLELYKKPNFCHLILLDSFGTRLNNDTYTGALNLLKQKKLDLYAKPEALYLNENFLEYSTPVFSERFIIGQVGLDTSNLRKDQNFLSIFDVQYEIIFYAILAFLIIFCILVKLIKSRSIKRRVIWILEVLFDIRSFNLTSKYLTFIMIFYSIYFMIYRLILTNNIKTNSVLVNTSEILEQKEDVLRSEKTICWMENENEVEMARQAAKETFLNKAYRKGGFNYFANDNSLCIFKKRPKLSMLGMLNKVIFLLSELLMSATFAIVSNFMSENIFWISSESIFEMVMVFYLRKDLKASRNFEYITFQEFECSLQGNLNNRMSNKLISLFEYKSRIYRKKGDFIKDFTQFDNLTFEYFFDMFKYGLIFYCVLLATFTMQLICIKLIKYHHL